MRVRWPAIGSALLAITALIVHTASDSNPAVAALVPPVVAKIAAVLAIVLQATTKPAVTTEPKEGTEPNA